MLRSAEQLEMSGQGTRRGTTFVEQMSTQFHTQNSSYGVVEPRLRNFAGAHLRVKRDVGIHFRPDARGSGIGCNDAVGAGRKDLVLHLDQFDGLAGDGQSFRNDKRDTFANEAHAIAGKRIMRRDEDRLAVAIAQSYVGRTDRKR